jgi:hypothetical protein
MRVTARMRLVFLLSAFLGMVVGHHRERTSAYAGEGAQDTVYLDRRISTLEMRLSTIESSLRSLEQQAMASQRMTQGQPTRDPEISLARTEIEMLRGRLRELECGLTHLDERTLSVTAREALKRSSGQSTDPCRLNPETPLQISPRR